MSVESNIVPPTEVLENRLYRLMRWALLGAAPGAVAGVIFYVGEDYAIDYVIGGLFTKPEPAIWGWSVFVLTPGALYGLAVGGALWRRKLANIPRVVALAAFSVCAWHMVVWLWLEIPGKYWGDAKLILLSGLIWSVLLTTGFAVLFPFARRPRLWSVFLAAVLAAGAITAGVLDSMIIGMRVSSIAWLFGTLWSFWYGVYSAILSTALPQRPTSM